VSCNHFDALKIESFIKPIFKEVSMAADSPNDLELALKKRARRRLVGAFSLVLLMVIVLPMVLQDRSALAPQETIKISMPDDVVNQQTGLVKSNIVSTEPQVEVATGNEPVKPDSIVPESPMVSTDKTVPAENSDAKKEIKTVASEKKADDKISANKLETKTIETKSADIKKNEVKASETEFPKVQKPEVKTPETKMPVTNGESFTIQVGVFSDIANVKQLQARLKEVGLDSHTENITTAKGTKIRLRAGRFSSRQEAAYALTKLQAADLTGMVISNN
jgi:DedD protein